MRVAPPTSTIALRPAASIAQSRNARTTGSRKRRMIGSHACSNASAVTGPSRRVSSKVTTNSASAAVVNCRRACSAARNRSARRRPSGKLARIPAGSMRVCISAASAALKSSPPSRLSPAEPRTSTMPSNFSTTETSNVPPPRSNTRNGSRSSLSCKPNASAAAVGSLISRRTSSPAICPARRVALRWRSLK